MKKKLVFVSLVLFISLGILQYFSMQNAFEAAPVVQEVVEEKPVEAQPAKSEIYSAGDYVVVKIDGKYYVYKKQVKST